MATPRKSRYVARRAADPMALQPISHDEDHAARAALHARTARSAPRPWARWALAEAYVTAEIYRTPRTLERCATLAAIAARRLGGITIAD